VGQHPVGERRGNSESGAREAAKIAGWVLEVALLAAVRARGSSGFVGGNCDPSLSKKNALGTGRKRTDQAMERDPMYHYLQGVTKRCRRSCLTNGVPVYEPKCGGGGSFGVSANQYSCTRGPK
jgi:hypothetical protein